MKSCIYMRLRVGRLNKELKGLRTGSRHSFSLLIIIIKTTQNQNNFTNLFSGWLPSSWGSRLRLTGLKKKIVFCAETLTFSAGLLWDEHTIINHQLPRRYSSNLNILFVRVNCLLNNNLFQLRSKLTKAPLARRQYRAITNEFHKEVDDISRESVAAKPDLFAKVMTRER